MKLSEINLNSETISRFFKKRGTIILSFIVAMAVIGATAWSLLFIYHTMNKAVRYDEKKVSGETKGIDMDSYNRLKDKWKDFQGGKYIAPSGNSVQININALNANSANANSANENANMAANTNGNVNTALNNNTSDMNTNQ